MQKKVSKKARFAQLAVIRAAVKRAGSIEALAKELDVDFSTAWRWYVGKTQPSALVIKILDGQPLNRHSN